VKVGVKSIALKLSAVFSDLYSLVNEKLFNMHSVTVRSHITPQYNQARDNFRFIPSHHQVCASSRTVINPDDGISRNLSPDWFYCGVLCDRTVTERILFNGTTGVNHLKKTVQHVKLLGHTHTHTHNSYNLALPVYGIFTVPKYY